MPLRLPSPVAVTHLRPFAMRTAFPSSDYYGRSVTLGLAAFRRSRVPASRTSERDVGPSFVPFNGLIGRRPAGGDFGWRKPYRPIPPAPPIPAVAEDVRFHPWGLRFRQCSFDPIARALRDDGSDKFARLSLFDHALVPVGFRVWVRSMAQKRLSCSGFFWSPGVPRMSLGCCRMRRPFTRTNHSQPVSRQRDTSNDVVRARRRTFFHPIG